MRRHRYEANEKKGKEVKTKHETGSYIEAVGILIRKINIG